MRRDLLWRPNSRAELQAFHPTYPTRAGGLRELSVNGARTAPTDAHSPARPPPIRTVMVPVDGTPGGEHALPLALGLARRAGARVTLVHVYSPLQAAGDPARLSVFGPSYPRAALRNYLEDLAGRAGAAVDMSVRPIFLEAKWVDEALSKVAEAEAPDLIVMANQARGWWDRLLRDSVTAGVVQCLQTPVLLVPAGEGSPDLSREVAIDRVLVPLDRSDRAESVLGPATAIGSLSDASYDLIHVVPPDPASLGWSVAYGGAVVAPAAVQRAEAARSLRSIAHRLQASGLPAQWEVVTDDRAPAQAIVRFADRTGADLIALATRARGPLSRLFRSSVVEKVIRQAPIPVLIHRPSNDLGPTVLRRRTRRCRAAELSPSGERPNTVRPSRATGSAPQHPKEVA